MQLPTLSTLGLVDTLQAPQIRSERLFQSKRTKTPIFKNIANMGLVEAERGVSIRIRSGRVTLTTIWSVQDTVDEIADTTDISSIDSESLISQQQVDEYNAVYSEGSLEHALAINGWNPKEPPKIPRGHYLDARELYYIVVKVIEAGTVSQATQPIVIHEHGNPDQVVYRGTVGERFCELAILLAKQYLGRIAFRDQGMMANLAEDLIHEAAAKCSLVAHRFKPWGKPKKDGSPRINNAFAYFTTITKNKMYETLDSPLSGIDGVFLEDLRAENQTISDIF